jgi:hypothetical protein
MAITMTMLTRSFIQVVALLPVLHSTIATITSVSILTVEQEEQLEKLQSYGICVPASNSCSKARCRLNNTISENATVPKWVTQKHQALVDNTTQIFRLMQSPYPDQFNDSLWSDFTKYYPPVGFPNSPTPRDGSWGRVCTLPTGNFIWATSSDMYGPSVNCTPGYLGWGAHPFGKGNSGYYLTQIISLRGPDVPETKENAGFFVSITAMDDYRPGTVPIDGQLDLRINRDIWGLTNPLDRNYESRLSNSTARTDQNLIELGFDFACCERYEWVESLGRVNCTNPSVGHKDCHPEPNPPVSTINSTYEFEARSENWNWIPPQCRPEIKVPSKPKSNSGSASGTAKGLLVLANLFVGLFLDPGAPFLFILASILIQVSIPGAMATYVRNETEPDDLRIASWGICIYPQNSCSSDARCRLNDTVIAAATKPIPDWVELDLRNLFNKTIAQFGKAYEPWERRIPGAATRYSPGRVCRASDGEWFWASLDGRYYDEFCYTAYMSLGFHPWEKREGWWLTQIVGQSLPGNGWGGGGLYLKHTLKGDFFVNVTRVWDWPGANVGDPVDGALDFLNPADNYTAHTAQEWEKRGRAEPLYNATRRTDQDIAANGFDYRCCEEEVEDKYKLVHCKSYNVLHQGCSTSGGTPLTNNSYKNSSNSPYRNRVPLCPGGKKVSGASRRLVPGVTVALLALAFVAVFVAVFE